MGRKITGWKVAEFFWTLCGAIIMVGVFVAVGAPFAMLSAEARRGEQVPKLEEKLAAAERENLSLKEELTELRRKCATHP